LPSTCCLWTRSGPPPASACRAFSRRTSSAESRAGGSALGFTRFWTVGFSMATAASAPAAAAASAAGGDEPPFAREGEAGHLLLDVRALAARAGDRLAPGPDVLLEGLVARVTDVLRSEERRVGKECRSGWRAGQWRR